MRPAPENELILLPASEWQDRRAAHERRVRAWTDPHQARAARRERHPIYDFLFDYYSFRPAWLRRWHPGPDCALGGESAREFLRWPAYREVELENSDRGTGILPVGGTVAKPPGQDVRATTVVMLDVAALTPDRRTFVSWLRELLVRMRERPAFFGCFGLHEWAMVHRLPATEVRHARWPLRFPREELARIVEQSAICCSHFDAFRFFTPAARGLNRLQPTREAVPQLEQRGCLHANMDLYKWAFKLAPFTPSELLADCFELARDIREVDMRASPYDLSTLGFEPIAIETAAGRADYERQQRAFTARGEPLRERLIALCERLLREDPSSLAPVTTALS
ncbi:3-methyladenine DNA glycosylase [Opitutus terrae]|uniref:3-methyladenine DNA glycosylase n=1 Tax=Opitutus terrae (strain DSM 11246 / JCM 15787 / PB90-1) TaxID=452637 RepID=B1ZVJ4_OPITP|nr:3-methyladenine DNA glycosylase [Opitutus terrae]ACB74091.1 conserved hypothetical protein [Opitutus terrae PB90-1]